MKLFLDASAFAKRFIEEPGSQEVEALCTQATELCLSVICVPEIVSALNRRLREKRISKQEYATAKHHLSLDVRDATIVNVTPEVVQASIKVLEDAPVRSMDAIHIASAVAAEADLFASADRRQAAAAKGAGLRTRLV